MLYEREQVERLGEAYTERVNQMGIDKQLREDYFQRVQEAVNALVTKDQTFYENVNQKIQKIFEDAYMEKLGLVFEKSKEAHKL